MYETCGTPKLGLFHLLRMAERLSVGAAPARGAITGIEHNLKLPDRYRLLDGRRHKRTAYNKYGRSLVYSRVTSDE